MNSVRLYGWSSDKRHIPSVSNLRTASGLARFNNSTGSDSVSVGSQSIVPFGTPEELHEEITRLAAYMRKGGGYVLAPTHWIQSGTPIKNILTLYETAKAYSSDFYRKRRRGIV